MALTIIDKEQDQHAGATNSPDINVTKYTEVASTAIHRIAASRPMSKSRSALFFFGAYILEKVYKYCGNGDRQDSVTYKAWFRYNLRYLQQ